MAIQNAVESYLAELREAGRRERTLRGYATDLRVLVQCVEASGGVLGSEAVEAYLAWPSARATATQARRLSALRGLLRSCGCTELLPAKPREPATPDSSVRAGGSTPAARSDVESVLAMIPHHADLDHLLFGILARLGLRPGEALELRVEDFDEESESLSVPGWGGKRRRVLVDDRLVLLRLSNYIRFVAKASGPLFTAPGRESPMRYQSVQYRWGKYCEAAGVPVQLADLRRAHAADLLAGGVPEHVVRERLGQRTGPLTGTTAALTEQSGDDEMRAWHERRRAGIVGETPDAVRQRRAG